jgi:transcriptional regulator with XRE-family HTH domain
MSEPATAGAGEATSPSAAVAFGGRLRSLRHRLGWSQQRLGTAIFFSREYVALVERGLRAPSATFVERAGAALDADGELRAAFAHVEQDRERAARQRAETRGAIRRRGKIVAAAGRLRAAARDEPTGERSPTWWTAFDELHHVLQDEITPVDADADITDLEQQCTDLAADPGNASGWADVASAAAQGLADAGALLQRPLRSDHIARLVNVARRFAAQAGDALIMLGQPGRAGAWYTLARAVKCRCSVTPSAAELKQQPASGAWAEHGGEPARPAPRVPAPPLQRATSPASRLTGGGCRMRRRHPRPRTCRSRRCGRCARAPPVSCGRRPRAARSTYRCEVWSRAVARR